MSIFTEKVSWDTGWGKLIFFGEVKRSYRGDNLTLIPAILKSILRNIQSKLRDPYEYDAPFLSYMGE